ncbi:MAG: hypothetical protein Q9192_005317 [Flavoplaca navasiana]
MAQQFTNNSCNPFLPRNASCSLGNYISYAVNASDAIDFQKTMEFVRDHNIRLTIRNTGHDYNGKATGAGAIGIWTHHMKSMESFQYDSTAYTGHAIKMGAGVQTEEAYQYAHSLGLVIVGAISPTVGVVGGYTQGGGHGPLASRFGLAADQALEWEVVTASGHLLIASRSRNEDLYWALSGGGGGTYGAVVSLTVKAYPEMVTSAVNLTFPRPNVNQDGFWRVVAIFQESLPALVDMGAYVSFYLSNESFAIAPIQGPGIPKTQMEQALNGTTSGLERENIRYNLSIAEFSSFYDSHRSFDVPVNVSQLQIGGRLIPRSLVQNNISTLIQAQRSIVDSGVGAIISGVCVNVSIANTAVNSVNPVWRTALYDAVVGTPFSYTDDSSNLLLANMMTNIFLPALAQLTPNGGAYINEADFQQSDFQNVLYGVNYHEKSRGSMIHQAYSMPLRP